MSRMEALHSEMTAPSFLAQGSLHWFGFTAIAPGWLDMLEPLTLSLMHPTRLLWGTRGIRVRWSLSHPAHRSPLEGTSEFPGQERSALGGY